MNVLDIQRHIKSKTFDKFYIFTGEDNSLMNNYIDKISSSYGGKIIRADKLLDVWGDLTQRSMFKTSSKNVYVVRDDKEVTKNEKLWSKFDNIINGILILIHTNLQKNTKIYKSLSEHTVEFNHMTVTQLSHYIVQKYGDREVIDEEVASYLAEQCKCDLGRIDSELDKIKLLNPDIDSNMYDVIDHLVYSTQEFNVFDFLDHLISRDIKFIVEDLNLVEDPLNGVNTMGLLTFMYNKLYDAAKVMSMPWDKDVEERTGVKYFIAKNIWSNIKYKPESLLTALRIIQDCEIGIKQGIYTQQQAVKSCILSILTLE